MSLFDYVVFKGEKFYPINGVLKLNYKGIHDLNEIENLKNLTNLKELLLQSNNIIKINCLEKLQNLTLLQLNNNKIENISGLESVENLEVLNLSNNHISEIKGLDNLKNLKKLDLFHNNIKEIKGFNNLINLKELILANNQITEIKGLNSLINLERLLLAENKIKKLEGLKNLNNLKELYLGANYIEKIKGLEKLLDLQILDLRRNNIERVDGLATLLNLKQIKLKNNKIDQPLIDQFHEEGKFYVKYCQNDYVIVDNHIIIVNEPPGLGYKNIKNILDLSDRGIKRISDIKNLEKLTHLEGLNLVGNQISEIEGLELLENLKLLWLSGNKIKIIQGLENLCKLVELSLNYNEISKIEGLEKLDKLKKLYLEENKIKRIENLKNLTEIKELIFVNNEIEEIAEIDTLINLEKLVLSHNNIKKLGGLNSLIKLKELFLVGNKIKKIRYLSELRHLELLNLEGNDIIEINNLENLIELKYLDLSRNKIQKIRGLITLRNLNKLGLEDNDITEIEGLECLTNLTCINLDENPINNKLYRDLKLSNNNPRLFVSYCILKPIVKGIKNKIIWSSLLKDYPYLENLNFNELKQIVYYFRYMEIILDKGKIYAIATPEYLAQELDHIIESFPEQEDITFQFIAEKLKLVNKQSAKNLCLYIIKEDLSQFALYDITNSIRKKGLKHLKRSDLDDKQIQIWSRKLNKKSDEIQKWLDNFKAEEQWVAINLLDHFKFITSKELEDITRSIYRKLLEEYPITSKDLIFVSLGGEAKSDKVITYYFRLNNNLPNEQFINQYDPKLKSIRDKYIVYLDDVAGTGKQLCDDWKKIVDKFDKEFLSKNKFIFAPIFITEDAKMKISEQINFSIIYLDNHLLTDIDCSIKLESGIFSKDDIKEGTRIIQNYGEKLYPKGPLGYGGNALLIAFFYNTPNNTLPIFWQESHKTTLPWYALFPRKEPKK